MKIFVIVGSIFPFDRLVRHIDSWIPDRGDFQVTAQIGKSRYVPQKMDYHSLMDTDVFNRTFDEADLIISHAGMGTILKSLVSAKPIIVMPRQLKLKEHNTNHQVDTARAFKELDYIHVAMDEDELDRLLEHSERIVSKHTIGQYASAQLIDAVRQFIREV